MMRASLEAASAWADDMIGLLLPIMLLALAALGVVLVMLLAGMLVVGLAGWEGC